MPRDDFVDLCRELLSPAGAVRAKRMFGGHGLYVDDLFVAIVTGERLFLKVDDSSQPAFEAAGAEPFDYEAKGRHIRLRYWTAPADAMESPHAMLPWVRHAIQAALTARATAAAPRRPRTGTVKPRSKARPPATSAASSRRSRG